MSNRTFKAHSSLGEQLQFRSMVGNEQISRLFEFRVRLISESSSISAKSLLGPGGHPNSPTDGHPKLPHLS